MNRKAPVSRETLFAVADEMAAETGELPTLQQLRDQVGGSFTTLGPLLNEWKAKQRQQSATVLEMPESVLAAVKSAGVVVWQAASQLAGEHVQQAEQEAQAKVEAAQGEAGEYAEEIARLEAALEQSNAEAEKVRQAAREAAASMSMLQAKVASLETSLADKSAELEKAEHRYEQVQTRVDGLQAELLVLAKANQRE